MSKPVSELEEYSDKLSAVDSKRQRMERYTIYAVIALAVLGLVWAGATSSIVKILISWFSPSGGHSPNIFYVNATSGNNLSRSSTQAYPTFNNSFVRFNASFNDSDVDDWHALVVCNGTAGNYTFNNVFNDTRSIYYNFSCGSRELLCVNSDSFVSDNPIYCDYYVAGLSNVTHDFTAYVVDIGGKESNVSGTFAVDRPPKINAITVTKA